MQIVMPPCPASLRTEQASDARPPCTPSHFWSIWEQYERYLFQRCYYRMNGNFHDAEDALSQVKLKALEKWSTMTQAIQNPKAWLTTLTDHFCVDLHRKSARQSTTAIDQIEIHASTGGTINAVAPTPEHHLLDHELNQILQSEIQNLPSGLQEVFAAYYLHGKTTRDISEQLAINENTIYKRLQKSRDYLKPRLKRYLQSNGYRRQATVPPLESTNVSSSTAVASTTRQSPIKQNFAITALCLELQPQLWSLSNIQLGWS